ncbi:MAG TPA: hypothetical protein VGG61_16930 [Gemmataceae bacterium]|jgi:hypothetical protein
MLALFCLRLAAGMIAALLILNPAQVKPRFFRVHFLTAFGLTAVAAFFPRDSLSPDGAKMILGTLLAASLVATFVGSVVWSLGNAPGGRVVGVFSAVLLAATLGVAEWATTPAGPLMWLLAGAASSAAVLGTATTAMLMGHSYLIAPAMSIVPLQRLLAALFTALLASMVLAGIGLWSWTAEHSLLNLEEAAVLWLPLRWGLGFVAPLVLCMMAWQTAKIRSTQSATGILYVVVIFCFLGELTGQLLRDSTSFVLQ